MRHRDPPTRHAVWHALMLGSSADRGLGKLSIEGTGTHAYAWPVPQGNQRIAVTEVEICHWSPMFINAASGSVVHDQALDKGPANAEIQARVQLVSGPTELTSDSTANYDIADAWRKPDIGRGGFGILGPARYAGLDMTLESGEFLHMLYRWNTWATTQTDAGPIQDGLALYCMLHATMTILDR